MLSLVHVVDFHLSATMKFRILLQVLSEVCRNVGVEPTLQPLDREPLQHATANREDGACLDVVARDFWGGIGSMRSLTLGCLILLFPFTRYMNRRIDKHMMKEFRRWRELAFSL